MGPLTLRVFANVPGSPCSGDLYTDDGKSYNFRRGDYLRLHITCSSAADGSLTVALPQREGKFRPWWTQFRIEAVGFSAHTSQAEAQGKTLPLEQTTLGWAVNVPDTGKAQTVTLR